MNPTLRGALLALPFLWPGVAAAADQPDSVNMDLSEFLRLYEAGRNRPDKPVAAPYSYTMGTAQYRGEVQFEDGEPVSVLFDGKFKAEVVDDKQWSKIRLLPVTVALRSVKIGGQTVSTLVENGWYHVLTNKKGPVEIDASFAAAVQNDVGASIVAFELTWASGSEVSLSVPGSEDLEFTVANAQQKKTRVEGGKRVMDVSLPFVPALSIRWQREVKAQEDQNSRVYAQVYTLVGLGDGVMTATATIDHTILFKGVRQLKAAIPTGTTLLDVRGSGIRDWALGADNVLTVDLNYAAEGAYTLALDLEKVVGGGNLDLEAPLVKPLGVERSKGWVGVEARGNIELSGKAPQGATAVDVRTLPAAILGVTNNPVLLGYKYLGTDAKVPISVAEHQNIDVLVTVIDQSVATTMFTTEGRRLTSVTYDVRNNRTQFLRLGLPAGAELWSAQVAGRAVQPAKAADGRVMIPLVRSHQAGGSLASFQVNVVYVESGAAPTAAGAGTFEAALPTPDAPSTYVGWTVYSPWQAKVNQKKTRGNMRRVDNLSFPLGMSQINTIDTYSNNMEQTAAEQVNQGSMGQGAAPVAVRLPVEGRPIFFEKLLALEETLAVEFDYKGLKKN